MKKKTLALMLVSAMMLSLAACGGGKQTADDPTPPPAESKSAEAVESTTPTDGDTYNITGTYEAAMSSPQNTTSIGGELAQELCDAVTERSGGKLTVNFFGGDSLGDQATMTQALASGELELIMDGTVQIDMYAPSYGFLSAPFMVKDLDHLRALIDSPVWEGLEAEMESNGVMILGTAVRGARQMVASKPIDLNNLSATILRSPSGANYVTAFSACGFNVQVIGGGEVYNSLANQVINATEGPWEQHVSLSMPEVTSYAYETNHMCEFYNIYASKAWFDSLDSEAQRFLQDTVDEYIEILDQRYADAADSSLQQLIDAGMTYEKLDTTKMIEACEKEWKARFDSGEWALSYDEVMSYAK